MNLYADSITLPALSVARIGTMVSDPDLPLETVKIISIGRAGDNSPTIRRVEYIAADGKRRVALVPRSAPVRTRAAVFVGRDVAVKINGTAVPISATITNVTAKTVTVATDGPGRRFTRREAGDGAITYTNGKDYLIF